MSEKRELVFKWCKGNRPQSQVKKPVMRGGPHPTMKQCRVIDVAPIDCPLVAEGDTWDEVWDKLPHL